MAEKEIAKKRIIPTPFVDESVEAAIISQCFNRGMSKLETGKVFRASGHSIAANRLNERWDANIKGREIISDYVAKNKLQGVSLKSINMKDDGNE
jgi:GH24 family phage-related lysozyme (muramidase)